MPVDLKGAYQAAKAARSKRKQIEEEKKKAEEKFPALAEQKLTQIEKAVRSEMPEGLALDVQYNVAGLMDERNRRKGVKGLSLKILEDGECVAEGNVGVASDHSVEIGDVTKHQPNQKAVFRKTTFEDLSDKDVLEFIADLIRTHIV
jgi:hypothetical protein